MFDFLRSANKKPLVLHADDEPESHLVIAFMLKELGCDCLEAFNGMEAVKLAESALPALILMDVTMPKLDGISACRLIKSKAATKHIPVIMVTASDLVTDVQKALDAGADGYLVKPVELDALKAKIESVVKPPPPAS